MGTALPYPWVAVSWFSLILSIKNLLHHFFSYLMFIQDYIIQSPNICVASFTV